VRVASAGHGHKKSAATVRWKSFVLNGSFHRDAANEVQRKPYLLHSENEALTSIDVGAFFIICIQFAYKPSQ